MDRNLGHVIHMDRETLNQWRIDPRVFSYKNMLPIWSANPDVLVFDATYDERLQSTAFFHLL